MMMGATVSMPCRVKPLGVCTSAVTATPPKSSRFSAWWQRASMWVPACSGETTIPEAEVRGSGLAPGSCRRCRV